MELTRLKVNSQYRQRCDLKDCIFFCITMGGQNDKKYMIIRNITSSNGFITSKEI